MTKKEKRVNKMWYTMWWQYLWITMGIVSVVIGLLATLILKDESHVVYGIVMLILGLLLHKIIFSVGNYYRERYPRYEEDMSDLEFANLKSEMELYLKRDKLTKKEIRTNKMWYTMWWQYSFQVIGVIFLICFGVCTLLSQDVGYAILGLFLGILCILFGQSFYRVGIEYREEYNCYKKGMTKRDLCKKTAHPMSEDEELVQALDYMCATNILSYYLFL